MDQNLLHRKQFLKILWSEVRKGGFQFLWKMVLWGATFNAVVVVGVVSLLLLKLPMAILCFTLGFPESVSRLKVSFDSMNKIVFWLKVFPDAFALFSLHIDIHKKRGHNLFNNFLTISNSRVYASAASGSIQIYNSFTYYFQTFWDINFCIKLARFKGFLLIFWNGGVPGLTRYQLWLVISTPLFNLQRN